MKRALAIAFCLVPAGLALLTIAAALRLLPPPALPCCETRPEPTCLERRGGGTAMTARPIIPVTVTGLDGITPPETYGPAPDLRWLPIERLVVDPAYQRDLNKQSARHIRSIVERFDWRLFSAVIVSPVPGGHFAIVDGQHRTTAAALCGIDSVPCQVIQADGGMQARAFEAINGKVILVSKLAQYKASLAAGDPEALQIRDLCAKAGIRMLTSNYGLACKAGDTMAYNAVATICRTLAEGSAVYVLRCARGTVRQDGLYLRAQTLAAMADVLTHHHPEWQHSPDFLQVAQSIEQEAAFRRAKQVAAYGSGIRLVDAMAAEIMDAMNHAQRGKKERTQ